MRSPCTASAASRPGCRSRWAATRCAPTASCRLCAAARSSRRSGEILAEVTRLARDGVREVTLLGQNVNSWGRDLARDRLRRALARRRRGPRNRAHPLHEPAPEGLPRDRHLGDRRLRRGLRARPPAPPVRLDPRPQVDAAHLRPRPLPAPRRRVRPAIPDLALDTDVIVGFPARPSATSSRRSRSSRRWATTAPSRSSSHRGRDRSSPAARTRSGHVKHGRIERLVDVVQRVAHARNGERVGRVEEVLVEGPSRTDPALLRGRTRRNTTVNFAGRRARRASSSTSASKTQPRRRFEASSWQPLQRSRDLAWDGLLNVRDLGGHPTEDGGETRFDSIVRADSVRQLSDKGWAALVDYGVKTIVDLRDDEELAADPPAELPVEVLHVPLFEPLGRLEGVEARLDAAARSTPDVRRRRARSTSSSSSASTTISRPRSARSRTRPRVESSSTAPAARTARGCCGAPAAAGGRRRRRDRRRLRALRGAPAPAARAVVEEAENEEELERMKRIVADPGRDDDGVFEELERRYGGVESTCGPRARPTTSSTAPARGCVTDLVLAIFGPTASGKSAVAARSRSASRRSSSPPTRCRSTAACRCSRTSLRAAARRDLAARPRSVRRRVSAARARGDRRAARRGAHAGRRRRHGPLPPGRPVRPVAPPAAGAGRARARWNGPTTPRAPSAHAPLAELDPEAAAAVHPNDRRRVVRSLELAGPSDAEPQTGSGPTTRAIRHSSSGSTSRRRARPTDRRADESHVRRGRPAPRRNALSPAPSPRRRPTHTASPTSRNTRTTTTRSRL